MSLENQQPPKPSKMTKFICQELLYEFALGRLSGQRQEDMDAFLTGCRESQRELEKLKRGLRFSAQSLGVKLAPEFHAELLAFEPLWKKNLLRVTNTSIQRGWKMLPYMAVLAVVVSGLSVFKPWKHKDKNEVTLVEQMKIEPDSVAKPAVPVLATNSGESPSSAPRSSNKPVLSLNPTLAAVKESAKPSAPKASEKKPTPGQGMLTRADLEVSDFANSSVKIKEKIEALGGKVAGNVELGWLKRKDESYFHFSLPESNRGELELFLKTFGPVRINTEPHPRVMPEGQIRIILTVKDGGSSDDSREEDKSP